MRTIRQEVLVGLRESGEVFPGQSSLPAKKLRVLLKHKAAVSRIWAMQNHLRLRVVPGARKLRPLAETAILVAERLEGGATVAECMHVLLVAADECRHSRESQRWFQPATLWRPQNFARKLGQVVSSRPSNGAEERTSGHARARGYDEHPPPGEDPQF